MIPTTEFEGFPKISRWSREVVVTEKIDGTNAQIVVSDDGTQVFAGSRTRWITPQDDNFGFARWVQENSQELLRLGPGRHFGEWWGAGIQRGYGLKEKRFSLFNTHRWGAERPSCCSVVPVLYQGNLDDMNIGGILFDLEVKGSIAAPGFMKPEGVVIFHTASGALFKKTVDKDHEPKGKSA
jgi:hypothetical protein